MKFKLIISNLTTLIATLLVVIGLDQINTSALSFFNWNEPSQINQPTLESFEDSVVYKIDKMQFKYPHIVLAQAKLESGHFKSKVFKQNNNMFGMKMPSRRPTVAVRSKSSYAYYNTWEESVIDLRIYYGKYMENKTEKQVYQFLSKYYAQDPEYVNKLKSMIEREQLKQKFNKQSNEQQSV